MKLGHLGEEMEKILLEAKDIKLTSYENIPKFTPEELEIELKLIYNKFSNILSDEYYENNHKLNRGDMKKNLSSRKDSAMP